MDKIRSLTPAVIAICRDKKTERPFSGSYLTVRKQGTFLCRRCGLALFRADNQFPSSCGWPSFDDALNTTVLQQPDTDGQRVEIICRRCMSHLGHVFTGEGYTHKNLRHCVNSLAIEFVESNTVLDTGEAILAAGCFWGVEYYLKHLDGVLITEVGYTGGHEEHPSYEKICRKNTGHFEAIRIVYDTQKIAYEKIIQFFFEIHDSTQQNGQGPDIGPQYLSALFYYTLEQYKTAQHVLKLLKQTGIKSATQLLPVNVFWPAEDYHQDYYGKQKKTPYCHRYQKLF